MQFDNKRFSLLIPLMLLCACLVSACSTGPSSGSPTTIGSTPTTEGTSATTNTPTTNTTTTTGSNSNSSNPLPSQPLRSIRMLDQNNGWSLTKSYVLKTGDGGKTWRSVLPKNFTLNETARASFRDDRNAWIAVTVQDVAVVNIIYTHDGGANWQSSSIKVSNVGGTATPMFVNNQVGWLEVILSGGAGSFPAYVYQTTTGGLNWTRVDGTEPGKTGLPTGGAKTGLSFKDTQNGWASGHVPSPLPFFYVTHDAGKTWQRQQPGHLPGSIGGTADTSFVFTTTPPVFFGDYGMLPVSFVGQYVANKPVSGLIILISNDGGQSWSSDYETNHNVVAPVISDNLYIVDKQHAWVSDSKSNDLYTTANGGKSWQKVASNIGPVGEFSFVDITHGWSIGPDSFQQTSDGGASWQKISYTIS